jgi:hypothetical protein
MFTPLAMVFIAVVPKVPPQNADSSNPFGAPLSVPETQRIAVTPKLDGRLDTEEWDAFANLGSGMTFLQWEPGRIHLAAITTPGTSLIASLDLKNDGWLVGDDNLEIRITLGTDGTAKIDGRILDAKNSRGPTWIELPGITVSSQLALGSIEGKTLVEATVSDPGLGLLVESARTKVGVRMDLLPSQPTPIPAYLPRATVATDFVMARAAGLPEKLTFRPENVGKSVISGESIRLRFAFEGNNALGVERLQFRTEGGLQPYASVIDSPFPPFDPKGRSFLDYESAISLGAIPGYRVLRGALKMKDGLDGLTQASIRIAPKVDVSMVLQRRTLDSRDRSYKEGFYIQSNSGKMVEGRLKVSVPEPLRMINGAEKVFRLNSRTRARESFEIYVPANTAGTFPVTFEVSTGTETLRQIGYVTIR